MSMNRPSSMLRDYMSARDAFDRFFDDRWINPGSWLTRVGNGNGFQYLPLDVIETAQEIVVRAFAPGVDPKDIDVTYQHGMLTIRVKMEAPELPEGGAWLMQEIGRGQAVRQVTLPRTVDVERVSTRFENGVLALTLPKTADAKPKQIHVTSAPEVAVGAAS